MKNIILISVFFYLFSFCGIAQNANLLIAEGDRLAEKEFKNNDALNKYLEADKLSPNNWEIYWRLSRTYVDIAEHMPDKTGAQKEAQLEKYQLSYDYANKAVKLAPDQSIVYLRRAIANGRIALFKGVFSVAGIVNDVKKDLDKAIALGNGGPIVQSLCHYVLARTHAKLAEKPGIVRWPLGLGWGDIDEALKEFKKAIKLRPDFRMYYLDYAKALIEEDKYDDARNALNSLLSSPKQDEDDEEFFNEAKKLLEKIKTKK